MQQMPEPEGKSYNEGYLNSTQSSAYSYDEQSRRSQRQYESQQKLRTESEAKLSTTNLVLAIMGVVTSSLIMGLSIALVALTANIFGRILSAGVTEILPDRVFGIIIAAFIVSLILLLFSIAGFVFSVVQLSLIRKKLKHLLNIDRSWY